MTHPSFKPLLGVGDAVASAVADRFFDRMRGGMRPLDPVSGKGFHNAVAQQRMHARRCKTVSKILLAGALVTGKREASSKMFVMMPIRGVIHSERHKGFLVCADWLRLFPDERALKAASEGWTHPNFTQYGPRLGRFVNPAGMVDLHAITRGLQRAVGNADGMEDMLFSIARQWTAWVLIKGMAKTGSDPDAYFTPIVLDGKLYAAVSRLCPSAREDDDPYPTLKSILTLDMVEEAVWRALEKMA